MELYQVRIFTDSKWAEIRSYADHAEALQFAQNNLNGNWNIKPIALEEANKVGASWKN